MSGEWVGIDRLAVVPGCKPHGGSWGRWEAERATGAASIVRRSNTPPGFDFRWSRSVRPPRSKMFKFVGLACRFPGIDMSKRADEDGHP